jgi:hypothetical protein
MIRGTLFMKSTNTLKPLSSLAYATLLAAAILLLPSLQPAALAQTTANSATDDSDPFTPVSATHQPAPIGADELVTQATFLLLTDPQGTMLSLKRLGQHPALSDLFSKPHNQQVLDEGDPAAIARLPEYQQLQQDPDVMSLFSQYRMDDPRLAALAATYWQRSQRLLNYPQLQSVLEDPAVLTPLQAGNPMPLLMHPQGLALLRTLFGTSHPTATP